MTEEPTLGDILAEALTNDRPGPAEALLQSIVKEACEQANNERQRIANRAMLAAGDALASDLAPLLNRSASEVFDTLGHMPDALLRHLQSPQGWSILAAHAAADLGRPAPAYTPTVH